MGGLRGLRSPLRYLLFDREFVDALIETGISDATVSLKASPGSDWPWRLSPLEAIAAVRAPRSPLARASEPQPRAS